MAVLAPPAPATRARRWPRILLWVGVALALVIVIAVAAVSWYFSGRIGDAAVVPQPDAGYPMTVTAVGDGRISYTGVPSGWDDIGLAAIATEEGGYAQTGDPRVTGPGAGDRAVLSEPSGPAIEVGQHARLDGWFFGADPSAVLGLPFQDVLVPTPLGDAPAWLVPGSGSTWVVYAHGRGDAPAQGLRMTKVFAAEGLPVLLISYRNDPGAPAGNGYAQFGADEWADLEAAVQYALDHGATNVILAGTSMGAALAFGLLEKSPVAAAVSGLFFDAPATNFGATVDNGAPGALPGFIVAIAKQLASWRFGLDWSAIDYRDVAPRITVPTAIVQGLDDAAVTPAMTREFVSAMPGDVPVLEVPGAGHTTGWNVDPQAVEQLQRGLIARVEAAVG